MVIYVRTLNCKPLLLEVKIEPVDSAKAALCTIVQLYVTLREERGEILAENIRQASLAINKLSLNLDPMIAVSVVTGEGRESSMALSNSPHQLEPIMVMDNIVLPRAPRATHPFI
jgi:hypothetical protein